MGTSWNLGSCSTFCILECCSYHGASETSGYQSRTYIGHMYIPVCRITVLPPSLSLPESIFFGANFYDTAADQQRPYSISFNTVTYNMTSEDLSLGRLLSTLSTEDLWFRCASLSLYSIMMIFIDIAMIFIDT